MSVSFKHSNTVRTLLIKTLHRFGVGKQLTRSCTTGSHPSLTPLRHTNRSFLIAFQI